MTNELPELLRNDAEWLEATADNIEEMCDCEPEDEDDEDYCTCGINEDGEAERMRAIACRLQKAVALIEQSKRRETV